MPLRFCMMTTFYPPCSFGGDGIFVENLSHELANRGHHVTVLHCIDTYRLLTGEEPADEYKRHPNIEIIGLRSHVGFLSPLITQQTGRPGLKAGKIRTVLERGFDVVNFHNISLVGGPGLLTLAHTMTKAVKLYTLHEYWLVCPTHTLFKFQRIACERRHCIACVLSYRRPPQLWRYTGFMRRAVQCVDAFITPDRFTAEKHREMGLELPSRYIPHFVPHTDHDSKTPPADLTSVARAGSYFLFVGRLERLKGLQTLIPVFANIRGARLLIAGTGEYEEKLRHLAKGLNNVVFVGHRTGATLPWLYRHAAGVVVPSINYEVAPPLIIMEAFRESTPVVVRNLGANPEPVQESGGGIVYNTEEELVSALNRLLSDPGYARELGHRGREMLDRQWSPDIYLQRYFALIDEVLNQRKKNI